MDLPESLRREALTYEVDGAIDYDAFCRTEGKNPLALYRMFQLEFAENLLQIPSSRTCSPQAHPSGFGLSSPIPGRSFLKTISSSKSKMSAVKNASNGLSRLGQSWDLSNVKSMSSFANVDRATVYGPLMSVPARYEDPLCPSVYIFHKGQLIGTLSQLLKCLFFTNHLCLSLFDMQSLPEPISADLFEKLKGFLEQHKKPLLQELSKMKENLAKERAIFDLAGIPGPSPEQNPETAPLVIRQWGEGDLKNGRGRSPHSPILCHNPEGEHRFIRSLRCPDGSTFRFKRAGSMPGTCLEPETHNHLFPVEDEQPGIIVDKYKLECDCGQHSGFLYFDMYHPNDS
jgi:hypothetical protein